MITLPFRHGKLARVIHRVNWPSIIIIITVPLLLFLRPLFTVL